MAAGRLTGLDTAFLCLDRDVSPMHLGGLAIFRPIHAGDPGRVICLLTDRVQRLPQLRQRVQPASFPLAAATWADGPDFRAEDHIHLHHLDCHGSRDKAVALAADLLVRPLPRTRPLWEFHVISGVGGSRFAVLFKMHHAFGDGLSALDIGFRVLDGLRSKKDGGVTSRVAVDDGSLPSTRPRMLSRPWRVPGGLREAVEGAVGHTTEATGHRRVGASSRPIAGTGLPAGDLVFGPAGVSDGPARSLSDTPDSCALRRHGERRPAVSGGWRVAGMARRPR